MRESVRPVTGREDEKALKTLMEKLDEGERLAREVYEAVRAANGGNGDPDRDRKLQSQLLYLFKKAQGYFVRLNWHDEVLFPHEASQTNLRYLGEAVRQLEDKTSGAPWRPCTRWITTNMPSSLTTRYIVTLRNT